MYSFDIHVTYSYDFMKFPSISFQLISHPNKGNHCFEVFFSKLVLFILELHLNSIVKPHFFVSDSICSFFASISSLFLYFLK